MEATMDKALKPIYHALDRNQFSKALKLTQEKPQSGWPITVALRIHCLHRCSKSLEACMELRGLLGVLGGDWKELDDRIGLLGLGTFTSEDHSSVSSQNLTTGGASSVTPTGVGSKTKQDNASLVQVLEKGNLCGLNSLKDKANVPFDFIHVLDLSLHQRQDLATSNVQPFLSMTVEDILDETTISTLAVTLSSLHLYQTLVKVYSFAIEQLQKLSSKSWKQTEILVDHMIHSYTANLKYIASLTSMTHKERILNLQNTVKAWEENQFTSMNLIKHLGVGMYQSWCTCATLEHYYSTKELLDVLPQDKVEEIDKLKKKILMLPRLVEMMAKKRIQNENGGFPPSADDWRLVIESLEVQGKYIEAIEILEGIDLTASSTRKIDDENDIKHHVGSLIQMTEKERLERIAKLCIESGDKDKAFHVYSNNLLKLMPDQWDYWKAIMECTDDHNKIDALIDLACEEGISRKIPTRGPRLARVALAAAQICQENDATAHLLADRIIEYAALYSSLVYCCFQDLRTYLELLVKKTCRSGEISDPVKKVLQWAHSQRSVQEKDDNATQECKLATLRTYISSIKICYEIWHGLKHQSQNNQYIYKLISHFIPKPLEILHMWERTSNLGTCSKDTCQKECLPGDDLILLLVQQLCVHDESGCTWSKVLSLGILEHAIHISPFNPYLKMTAINMYSNVGGTARALELFEGLDIKQVQLESCSYLILQRLVDGGLYNESIKQAGKIINLHTTSQSDLCKYMTKSFENGNIQKGREMLRWQTKNMTPSLQLLEAKGIIMDLAPFHNYVDMDGGEYTHSSPIGLCHGLCGGDNDKERVEKMIRDSDNSFGAPSILRISASGTYTTWSDNRDFDINQYEILQKTNYHLDAHESMFRSHVHSILSKLVLFSGAVKAPKKGKVVHVNTEDVLFLRGVSLMASMRRFEMFVMEQKHSNVTLPNLSMLMIALSRTCAVLGAGTQLAHLEESKNEIQVDDISTREKYCLFHLQEAVTYAKESILHWKNYKNEIRTTLSRILPDIWVHCFATFNVTAKIFALFGWGKRKRNTKAAAACMAEIAESLYELTLSMKTNLMNDLCDNVDLIMERMHGMFCPKANDTNQDHLSMVHQIFVNMCSGDEMIHKVMHHIAWTEKDLRSRLLAILMQMETEFHSFLITE